MKKETGKSVASGKILGYAAVDSGQLLVIDPCYLADWQDGESDDLKSHYGKACKITEQGGGELLVSETGGKGVVFTSGLGDGLYPVTAIKDKDGRIKRVVIHFN